MLGLIKGAYPSFDPAVSGAYYRDELTRGVGLHGRGAVEEGLKLALRDTNRKDPQFVPTVAVILGYIRGESERSAEPRSYADRGCRECSGNGWVLNAEKKAIRCQCWLASRSRFVDAGTGQGRQEKA